MIRLFNLDYQQALRDTRPVRMIFADPPDAIGMKYNGFEDKFTDTEYRDFLRHIVYMSTQVCEVLWLSINSRHTFMVGGIIDSFIQSYTDWEAKACVQTFTFSQHNHHDMGNGHRPIYRIMRKGMVLYPEQIRVPSWRQLNGDKRADPRGKVPNDVFDFPRVTGNSKQRRKFSPTQLHEGLYERCIRLSCKPGDTVLDPFAGSGTLGRVAERCEVHADMVEVSKEVCEAIAIDQGLKQVCCYVWAKPSEAGVLV